MESKKIGDTVYFCNGHHSEQREVTCPVCFGKLSVVVILGDETRVTIPCEYCGSVYSSPRGVVTIYDFGPLVHHGVLGTISEKTTSAGVRREYGLANDQYAHSENIFATEAEAMSRAVVLCREHSELETERLRVTKNHRIKKLSWVVGYHKREAADHLRQSKYHDERARVVATSLSAKTDQKTGAA